MIFVQLRLYLNPLVQVNCGIITVQLGVLPWIFRWFQTCETCARLQNGLYIYSPYSPIRYLFSQYVPKIFVGS